MKYLSTFSGIGGFELGIQQAYETKISFRDGQTKDRESATPKQSMEPTSESILSNRDKSDTEFRRDTGEVSCIGFSEIDKYAASIYQRHFPNHKNYGDITTINAEELPDFDLLVGGFPCQAFSIAGKRGGFEDTRGTMFFELARILKAKQPRLFVFENVKGLLSHDGGKSFSTIIQTADELGYDLQWQVLNSKNHGVPQNRERVFIIGHLRGTSRPEVFPFGEGSELNNGKAPEGNDLAYCLQAGNDKHRGSYIKQLNQPTHSNDRVYGTDGVSPTLNTMQGGNRQPFIPEDSRIRRLTPAECERLQGFPDGWTELGVHDCGDCDACHDSLQPPCTNLQEGLVSDTQRYKTLGNAVTVNVIKDIMERLI